MEFANQRSGLGLPKAISFEQRYGIGPWQEADGEEPEAAPQQKQKGEWLNKAGDAIQALPGLFCTLFPKQCNRSPRPNNTPIIVQSENERDWLTTTLLVVIVLVLLVLILKK